MHSFLISGGTQKDREVKVEELCRTWRVAPFDRFMIEEGESSIGIAAVRTFIKQLSLAPQQSDWYIGVIQNAERLTVEAQQALLKTLEEPPPHARILITTAFSDTLLPTILSRTQRIVLRSGDSYSADDKKKCWQLVTTLPTLPKGERVAKLSTIAKTKEDGVAWITLAISTVAEHIVNAPDEHKVALSQLSHRLMFAKKMCSNNVHPLLLLEHVFLTGK